MPTLPVTQTTYVSGIYPCVLGGVFSYPNNATGDFGPYTYSNTSTPTKNCFFNPCPEAACVCGDDFDCVLPTTTMSTMLPASTGAQTTLSSLSPLPSTPSSSTPSSLAPSSSPTTLISDQTSNDASSATPSVERGAAEGGDQTGLVVGVVLAVLVVALLFGLVALLLLRRRRRARRISEVSIDRWLRLSSAHRVRFRRRSRGPPTATCARRARRRRR